MASPIEWIRNTRIAKTLSTYFGGGGRGYWFAGGPAGSRKQPTSQDLVNYYFDLAFSFANLNARGVAKTPRRLYVTTSKGQRKARVPTKAISNTQLKRLQSEGVHAKRLASADNVEEVLDHPLLDLMAYPCRQDDFPLFDEYSFIEMTQLFLEIVGRAYWYVEKNRLFAPSQLWIMHSHLVHVVKPTEEQQKSRPRAIEKYIYGGIDYKPEEVIAFRMASLNDPYTDGVSPMRAAFPRADVVGKFLSYTETTLGNRARPDAIATAKDGMTTIGENEANRLELYLNQTRGGKNNGGIYVARDAIDVKTLSWTPTDMGVLANDESYQKTIARCFDIPLSMTNRGQARAEAEAGKRQHQEDAILPRCRRMRDVINGRLIPLYDPTGRLFMEFDNPVEADRELEDKLAAAQVKDGRIVINEWRQENGWEPAAYGDVAWMPQNLRPVKDGEPPPTPTPIVKPPAAKSNDVAEGQNQKQLKNKATGAANSAEGEPTAATTQKKGHSRQLPDGEAFVNPLRKIFDEQQAEVGLKLAHWERTHSPDQGKAFTGAITKDEGDLLPDDKAFESIITLDSYGQRLFAAARPAIELYFDYGGRQAVSRYDNFPEAWNVQTPFLKESVDNLAMALSKNVNNTTEERMREVRAGLKAEIREGLFQGESVRELQKRINGVFEEASSARALTIAQSESSRAMHNGELKAMKMSGVVVKKKWLLNAAACPMCEAIAMGTEGGIALDQEFAKVGNNPDYSTIMVPPAHPNCVLPGTKVEASEILRGYSGLYDGPVYRIMFSGGEVTVTANHLFLTNKGFAKASSLRNGDNLLRYLGSQRESIGNPNINREPTLIEDVIASLPKSGSVFSSSVPVAAEHIHGDGAFMYGQIDIVSSESLLRRNGQPIVGELSQQIQFLRAIDCADGFSSSGNFTSMLFALRDATDSGVGVRSESEFFRNRKLCHSHCSRLTGSSWSQSSFEDPSANGWPTQSGDLGNSKFSFTGIEETDNSAGITGTSQRSSVISSTNRNSMLLEPSFNRVTTDSNRISNALRRFSSQVSLCDIIDIEVSHYCGPVYDLQTEQSLYVAGGVVVSNCGCTMIEVLG